MIYYVIMDRLRDKNMTLFQFEDEIFVECPKCEKRAIVTKEEPFSYYSVRMLKCLNCFYSEKSSETIYSIKLNCNCAHCSENIEVNIPTATEKKETIAVRCKHCGNTENYKPRNIAKYRIYEDKGLPREYYFGLTLWLNKTFKENSFWAYNYKHLAYLKDYISAGLRERNNRSYWTMVEKLPNWMKSSKNREQLVKIISELEKK